MTFLITFASVFGFAVGIIHIGFALVEDTGPRVVWDWYVVAMGFSMLAMGAALARQAS